MTRGGDAGKFGRGLVKVLVLVDDEPVSFSAVRAHILPGLSSLFLNMLTVIGSTCCGRPFQTLITLLEKNDLRNCGPASRLEQLPSVATGHVVRDHQGRREELLLSCENIVRFN